MAGNPSDPLAELRVDFRRQLEVFYGALKLAPPYDSVEKAIARLLADVKALAPDDQVRLLTDAPARWEAYRRAFVDSGLHLKHRGILAGLAKQGVPSGLPNELAVLLDVYRRPTS